MFEKLFEYFSINNPIPYPSSTPPSSLPSWYFPVIMTTQISSVLFSACFLGLLIWSIILFIRNKKHDPTSQKFLPRVLGFSFALALSVIGLALTFVYLG